MSEGTVARVAAINAGLRPYRPACLHMFQLKTFWHELKMTLQDIDFHSFETLETTPHVRERDWDDMTRALVEEMRAHKADFERSVALHRLQASMGASASSKGGGRGRGTARQGGKSELERFWLRKSAQPWSRSSPAGRCSSCPHTLGPP